ncbi:MAG: hypothetical protein KKC76_04990 [Proteobacteria bacterium]|nr:hypothetical protein [Pseudomonadota bacterium]MBU4295060.1 hypothetical protein [Pseudomonadota bacterium]MCG2748051.1 hypothetical protein [Desulfobulbaceae bacterium]
MPRDRSIRKSFEIADDGLQGTIGYFFFVIACKDSAKFNEISQRLPPGAIPVTQEWVRFYDKEELVQVMESCFNFYHARICLISSISIFESALKDFITRLNAKGHISNNRVRNLKYYKQKLEWAFEMVSASTYGTRSMKARIPDLCLQVDHARRIRNLWMHNNGLLNKRYKTDCISIPGKSAILVSAYDEYKRTKRKIPIGLTPESFIHICCSHVELLHQLHYNIQKQYFGQQRAYSYRASRKKIEWHRLLIGM